MPHHPAPEPDTLTFYLRPDAVSCRRQVREETERTKPMNHHYQNRNQNARLLHHYNAANRDAPAHRVRREGGDVLFVDAGGAVLRRLALFEAMVEFGAPPDEKQKRLQHK